MGLTENKPERPKMKNEQANQKLAAAEGDVATKGMTIKAGLEMMSRSTPDQQALHQKVIDWIQTLKNVPSTDNAASTYRECCREWRAIHMLNKPQGTGAYKLETI